MPDKRRRHVGLIITFILMFVLSATSNVVMANKLSDDSANKSVCELLKVELDALRGTPPTTPAGLNLGRAKQSLYDSSCSQR